jgi:LPS sulfotransferase NodH
MGRPLMVRQQCFVPDDGERCEDPIFVLGVHRSGTSLLRRILNSHSGVACPPESFFLKHFCDLYQSQGTRVGLQGFGFSDDEEVYRDQIAAWAARYHEAYRKGCGKRRWADKTPAYVAIASDLAALFGPAAQFVALYRHPFDIV